MESAREKMNLRRNMRKEHILKGWKYAAFIGGIVGFIGITIYPIIIDPMLNPDKYKKMQAENRKGINQADIQPGNMRVWSDPFKPQPKEQ